MRNALIAAVVAAVVASGSAMATTLVNGRTTGQHAGPHGPPGRPAVPPPHAQQRPHAGPSSRPTAPPPHGAQRAPSAAAIQAMIAAWSAAHPGWKNPADMTQRQALQAAIAHPEVYAPDLSRSSRALRTIQQYGAYATLPPQVLALMRAHGWPIPTDIPYVPPSEYVPAKMLARLKAAGVDTGR